MIAYTMVGTNDLDRATAFYDALLAEIGGKRAMDLDGAILYAGAEGAPIFCICTPADGNPASVGNGSMIAFAAKDPAEVDRLYARAIELGATDAGKPGARSRSGFDFYAAYFRDPDGNKFNFISM
ncbi:VOC family protein [Limibaculum sp. FT325]|uniref:VOC family protein n=1 Tax=Thermohalobaculum sediminis TaxID=2939436 RepID=UPI0020C0B0B5|nr:VOC family protein [Limibaculum sediminis]MCL5775854.1 VOC family protein [Limibaculum sediminis]